MGACASKDVTVAGDRPPASAPRPEGLDVAPPAKLVDIKDSLESPELSSPGGMVRAAPAPSSPILDLQATCTAPAPPPPQRAEPVLSARSAKSVPTPRLGRGAAPAPRSTRGPSWGAPPPQQPSLSARRPSSARPSAIPTAPGRRVPARRGADVVVAGPPPRGSGPPQAATSAEDAPYRIVEEGRPAMERANVELSLNLSHAQMEQYTYMYQTMLRHNPSLTALRVLGSGDTALSARQSGVSQVEA